MSGWAGGALQSIKTATDLIGGLLKVQKDAAVAAKAIELTNVLIELQGKILTAQAEQAALTGQIDELKEQLMQFEDWATEKQRYQLHRFETGAIAYVIKPEIQDAGPTHHICANCYEEGIKASLQPCDDGWFESVKCHRCDSVVRMKKISGSGFAMSAPARDPYRGF